MNRFRPASTARRPRFVPWRGAAMVFAALAALLAMPAGEGALAAQQVRDLNGRAPRDFVISPDDLLSISVFDVPEMSGDYRVSPAGSIEFPLLQSPITAAGLTLNQLSAAVCERLRAEGLVSAPQVTVQVKESRLHAVLVTGAVKKPQIYPVFGSTTLLEVIAQAEGLADDAGGVALITRGAAEGEAADSPAAAAGQRAAATVSIDLKRLMETSDPRLNLTLYPGDRVSVQRAGVVYVVGAVNRPGGFVLTREHEPMTVLKALALAEDLKATARANKALILQPKSSGSGEDETPVRLQDILAGRTPDQPLRANDILFVPDSNSQRALRRAAEAAVQAATGVIIWRLP